MTTLLLILAVGLPLAWLAAEFRAPTAVRITLGILSIGILSFALFSVTQVVRRYEKDFLGFSFQDMKRLLEAGRSDVVLKAIDSYQAAVTNDTAFSFQSSLVLRDALKRYAAISEPDGAANGSQPTRSETNRASSAAGSRR
jgi:hypothetical protein